MSQHNIHALARGVIIDQDHILLAYDPRAHPNHYYELNRHFYYLPGGHIDFQESAQKALIREIREETGYNATIERFLGIIEHAWSFSGDETCCHTHEVNMIFKIHVHDLKLKDALPQKEEHVAFAWVPLDRLRDIDIRPFSLKQAIPEWLAPSSNKVFWSTML